MYFDINEINPYIRVARPSVLVAGTEIKRRVIFDYELIYIESGEFVLNYNERDYKCKEGQFVLLRPGVPHRFSGIKKDVSQPHIHFDIVYSSRSPQIPISYKDICEFTSEELKFIHKDIFEGYPKEPFVTFKDKQGVLALFYSAISEYQVSTLVSKAKMIQIIERLISDSFSNCFLNEEEHYHIAKQLKDYIDAGQGITSKLSDLEKWFSYSKYYLERQFKKQYGMSLIAYRNHKRMQLAEKLLENQSVSEVSETLGFTSIYVFSRAFKQYFGISPTGFKKDKQSFD